MNHFEYRDGELACEDLALRTIAEAVGTPVYVYSTATLERHYTVFRDSLRGAGLGEPMIAYAVKANPNLSVLKTLAALGAGAYGASMSSEYNSRPLVPEVLVRGDRYAVVRPRPTYEDMLAREPLAEWL